MRKAMLGLLIVLCLWGTTSWQAQPQWRVVQERHIIRGTSWISNASLFTPKEAGLYRMSAYCSDTGQPGGVVTFTVDWTDLPGYPATAQVVCEVNDYGPLQSNIFLFSPKAGTPVTWGNVKSSGYPSEYNAAVTIEQLQQ